jgi:hypothetical protein
MKLFPKLGYIDFCSVTTTGSDGTHCDDRDNGDEKTGGVEKNLLDHVKIFFIDATGTVDDDADVIKECFEYYRKHQIVVIRPRCVSNDDVSVIDPPTKSILDMAAIKALLDDFPTDMKSSITMESIGSVRGGGARMIDSNDGLDVDDCLDDAIKSESSKDGRNDAAELGVAVDIINHYHSMYQHCSWYLSFIVQQSSTLLDRLSSMLPFPYPPLLDMESSWGGPAVHHYDSFWVFVGNSCGTSGAGLQGRREHTDSVTHSGTWHYQVSGRKVWMVRPCLCDEWEEQHGGIPVLQRSVHPISPVLQSEEYSSVHRGSDGLDRLHLECIAGDVLIINTRLWWHQTVLPTAGPQSSADTGSSSRTGNNLSISVARDFSLQPEDVDVCAVCRSTDDDDDDDGRGGGKQSTTMMSNCDGIYATRNLNEGDVICTEEDLPDCSLPRTKTKAEANSEVAWMKMPVDDDGGVMRDSSSSSRRDKRKMKYRKVMVLVATRSIKSGEWFTIVESDEEDG